MLKIVICANAETLACGYLADDSADVRSITGAAFAIAQDRESAGEVSTETDSFFPHWHGGKYDRCGEKVAGERWGYRCGFVACPSREVPDWAVELIDRMDAAMCRELESQAALAESGDSILADIERQEEIEAEVGDCDSIDYSKPVLYCYSDGGAMRNATAAELAASREAAESDGGAGMIEVDGIDCYVQE